MCSDGREAKGTDFDLIKPSGLTLGVTKLFNTNYNLMSDSTVIDVNYAALVMLQ